MLALLIHQPHRGRCWLAFAALALAACPLAGQATVVISGDVQAAVGNLGNPVTQQGVPVSAPGSYGVGPLTGSGGGNHSQGSVSVALGPSLPSITASASGSDDGVVALDGATASVDVSLSYNFSVLGPAPLPVPVRFAGSTFADVSRQGDPSRFYDRVGTRLRITSINIAGTFAPVGAQGGTAPDYYASNAGMVNLGWGAMAFGPVNYDSYTSDWTWGAELPAGQGGTLVLSTSTRGGIQGALSGSHVLTATGATSMIDPRIYIDPAWLAQHPGYEVVVDAGVGNVGAVPEPATKALWLGGFAWLGWLVRRRGKG